MKLDKLWLLFLSLCIAVHLDRKFFLEKFVQTFLRGFMYQNGYLSLNSYTMTASSELTLQIWNSTYHNEIILQEMHPMKQTWLQKLHANENTYAGWERERERRLVSHSHALQQLHEQLHLVIRKIMVSLLEPSKRTCSKLTATKRDGRINK